jgi:DNA-binding Xre family transcriptional regulator
MAPPPAAAELARQTFGANVKARRGPRPQAEVAPRARITQSTLSKIERGTYGEISLSLVLRLAVALECSATDLIGFLDQTVVIAGYERSAA